MSSNGYQPRGNSKNPENGPQGGSGSSDRNSKLDDFRYQLFTHLEILEQLYDIKKAQVEDYHDLFRIFIDKYETCNDGGDIIELCEWMKNKIMERDING